MIRKSVYRAKCIQQEQEIERLQALRDMLSKTVDLRDARIRVLEAQIPVVGKEKEVFILVHEDQTICFAVPPEMQENTVWHSTILARAGSHAGGVFDGSRFINCGHGPGKWRRVSFAS